jgi:hypothetical protein
MTTELTEDQREHRRQQARNAIEARLSETRKAWAPALRRPDTALIASLAMDALGDLAAEILTDGTMMRALTVKDGVATLELEPATDILKIFVASMRGVLDGYGAENYVETEMSAPSVSMDMRHGPDPRDSYTVTIQRRTHPTPHEFRQRAEAARDEAEAARDEAQTQLRQAETRAQEAEAAVQRVRSTLDALQAQGAIGRAYHVAITNALGGQATAPHGPTAGLVVHGDPIDIGWVNGRLDGRLRLYVHSEMDPIERKQLLVDLRNTIGALVPVRPASQEVSP